MRWELLRRRSEGSGSVNPQASPASRPTAYDTGRHAGWDTPVKPAAEAVEDHQGPRSESRGQPPAEVGDSPAQRVKKLPVERYTRNPWSWIPIAVEDEQRVMRVPSPSPTWSPQRESLSQTQRKPKNFQAIWRLSFSRWPILRSRLLLKRLTWRWGHTS